MWNNKKIKVHNTYGIGIITQGDIITVDENKKKILTVNGKSVEGKQGEWSFPSLKEWEIIEEFEVGKWYEFKAFNLLHIGKFYSRQNNALHFEPWIISKNSYSNFGTFDSNTPLFVKELKVEDEAIQNFLPLEHIDKIKKEVVKTKEEPNFKYAEALKNLTGIEKGKIYPICNGLIIDGKYNNYPSMDASCFKSSSKEAYKAQGEKVEKCVKSKMPNYIIVREGFDSKHVHEIFDTSIPLSNITYSNWSYSGGWEYIWETWGEKYFFISSKEAYDSQNNPPLNVKKEIVVKEKLSTEVLTFPVERIKSIIIPVKSI